MALTTDILRANSALSLLTEEQLAAITTLSNNDENSVIAKKTGEIYGGLDADILSVSGVGKNGTEKTFDYAKRVLLDFKTKVENANVLQTQVNTLTKEKERLEKAIADGSVDTETAKALKQAKADLQSVTTQYNELKTTFDNSVQTHANEVFGIRIESDLKASTTGLKFKSGLPQSAIDVLLNQAIGKIKGMNPEYIDDGKGGKVLTFKDETGAIMRNPNNQLNPYTTSELLSRELDGMGILEKGRNAAGAGTGSNTITSAGGGAVIDIQGVKTRVEAYDSITAMLTQQGLKIGTAEFDAGMSQAWKDNNISALPEK